MIRVFYKLLTNTTDGSSKTSCFSDPAVRTCLHYYCQPRAELSGAAELPELPTLTNQTELRTAHQPTATGITLHRQRNVNVSGTHRLGDLRKIQQGDYEARNYMQK